MATDKAALPAETPTDPTRHMWQVPVLLVGIVAFVTASQGWVPLVRTNPESAFARDIATLKTTYEKLTPDIAALKLQLTAVAANVDTHAEHAALARFHLGSGYVRLAEVTAAPEEARGYWTLARQHFELVIDNQLRDPSDVPRLAFRTAKSRAAIGLAADAPTAEISLLATVLAVPPPGEEPGETKRLIADLAMRQSPPDLALAKVSLTQYLTAAGIATPPASLARARLRLGEIYLRTREYDRTRQWLTQIGADAPIDVFAPAKAALARVYISEGDFTGAAKELETLRATPGVPPFYRIGAAYDLGVCRLQSRNTEAAATLFEEATKSSGPEANAAAIRLADLYLKSPEPARRKAAAELLANAVKCIPDAAADKSELMPLNEVQTVFELAVKTLLADNAFEAATKTAEAFGAISANGRERRADVLAAWAVELKKTNSDAAPKFQAAADEYAALAAYQPKTEGKLDLLRRAASFYRQAEQPASAVVRLTEAAKLPGIPEETVGPVLVDLADAMIAAGLTDKVWPLFTEIMAAGSLTSTQTRYRLARQFVDSNNKGLAPVGRALFEQIAKQENIMPSEREYHERALTELANDLIKQGNFADAEARLHTQLGVYPDGLEADVAKLLLGVCLLHRASGKTVAAEEAVKMHTEAVAIFKQLVAKCDAAERRNPMLSERETWLRVHAGLRILQTYQHMKRPQDLLFEAAALLERHKGAVEELIVLSLVYHAFKQMDDKNKMYLTRERMKEVFDKLPSTAFSGKTEEYNRDYWLKVWFTPEPK